MPKEIYHSDPISIPEVRKLLLERAKEGEELSYMQRIALEHAQLISRISADAAKHLIENLVEKFRISTKGAITLANYLPDSIDEIRQLLGKEAGNLETETLEEIRNTILSLDKLDESIKKKELEEIDEELEELEEEEVEVDESMIPEDLR